FGTRDVAAPAPADPMPAEARQRDEAPLQQVAAPEPARPSTPGMAKQAETAAAPAPQQFSVQSEGGSAVQERAVGGLMDANRAAGAPAPSSSGAFAPAMVAASPARDQQMLPQAQP